MYKAKARPISWNVYFCSGTICRSFWSSAWISSGGYAMTRPKRPSQNPGSVYNDMYHVFMFYLPYSTMLYIWSLFETLRCQAVFSPLSPPPFRGGCAVPCCWSGHWTSAWTLDCPRLSICPDVRKLATPLKRFVSWQRDDRPLYRVLPAWKGLILGSGSIDSQLAVVQIKHLLMCISFV